MYIQALITGAVIAMAVSDPTAWTIGGAVVCIAIDIFLYFRR